MTDVHVFMRAAHALVLLLSRVLRRVYQLLRTRDDPFFAIC